MRAELIYSELKSEPNFSVFRILAKLHMLHSPVIGRRRLFTFYQYLMRSMHATSVSVKRRHSVFDAQNFGKNAQKRKTVRQVTQRIFR